MPQTVHPPLWRRLLARPAIPCLLIAAVAALSLARQWGGPVYWEVDALFYQSQTLELRGRDAAEARREVFAGPLSQRARTLAAAAPGDPARFTDSAWVEYSARNYRRRWVAPLLAAGVYPVLGVHSLETWSLLGYVALGPLLFLLLRRRFRDSTSVIVTLGCLAIPPLRDWALFPLTDTLGLALLTAGLLIADRVLDRGRRWLPVWFACVLALALTRDTAVILVVAAVLAAVVLRGRRAAALAGVGVLAAAPAPLLAGPTLQELMAYVVGDFAVPRDPSWGFVLDHYPAAFGEMVDGYAGYAAAHPLVMVAFLGGLVSLYLAPARRAPLIVLLRAVPAGYLLVLLLGPTFSSFRYELVLLPSVAAGWAFAVSWGTASAALARERVRKPAVPQAVDQA